MTRLLTCILVVTGLVRFVAHSQSVNPTPAVATITASATVVGNVDLIVMKDLEFEIVNLTPAELTVDPQRNPHAGQIKVVGTPNSLIRVTYERESILRHEGGESPLRFTYSLSGGKSLVQRESALLTQNNQVRLSDGGVFYLWVGGRLSGIEDIAPGDYDMELTLELEYIQ